ncbi:histidinol-phosphate transaminase [Candidatus Saccharibacteria bacterium]|nr:histidinol-phosphate transaminase [Candidatus Saccharibacteria bacterium]
MSNSRIVGSSDSQQSALRQSDSKTIGQSDNWTIQTIRPLQYICDLSPYQPGMPIELVARKHGLDPNKIIKLASNENPLGMSPRARQAVERTLDEAHIYPDQYQLTHKLAARLGVTPEHIVLGNGSNDVLDLIARTFLDEGREAVSSRYAFAIYAIATQSVGARNIIVADKDFGHDLDAMLAAITPKTGVVWIANPNNPTGTLVPARELKQCLEKVPQEVVVVLDEAYYEYLEHEDRADSISWLKEHPNLIVVRTFSKAYGLAGLRVGYAVAAPEVAELLNRVRQPFNVNLLALSAAEAALDDEEFLARTVQANRAGRKQLLDSLAELGLQTMPAHGNFVTVRVPNAAETSLQLLKAGVIIRPLASYGLADWLRVSIGTEVENQVFLTALSAIVERQLNER